jgi:hypothetical protein
MKLKRFTNNRDIREKTESREKAAAVKKSAGRQLIVSSCLTFLCVLVLAAATMAWFANNRTVDSSGMQMQVETSPNLIIAQTAADIASASATDSSFSTTFSTAAQTLIPSTHDWGTFNSNSQTPVASTTGLKYNCNPSVISAMTGEAKNDQTIYYNKSENDTENGKYYYTDYTVYIASVNKPLPINGLTATLSSDNANTSTYDYHNAASVDFYLGSVSSSNYKGTLNLAGKNYNNNDAALTEVSIISGSYTVPLNTAASDNYIKVIMRFYFDGALKKNASPSQAYVHSDGLTTAAFSMKVTFTAGE